MASRCSFPLFNFPFAIPPIVLSIPIPDLDFSFNLDLFCPLD
jgi:hypothetical protein